RLEQAKSNARYSFVRALDNTEAIAATLARFVRYRRSYDTVNNFYRLYAQLLPADLERAARKYFTDQNMVVTTLAKGAMPPQMAKWPELASFSERPRPMGTTGAAGAAGLADLVVQKTALPQLN